MTTFRVPELDDPSMELGEWREVIGKLIDEFGAHFIMHTDAGYNNVSFVLTGEKRD